MLVQLMQEVAHDRTPHGMDQHCHLHPVGMGSPQHIGSKW